MNKVEWKEMSVEEIATLICSYLVKKGMNPVLSGGSCVSIYSNNKYMSHDLDFVMSEFSLNEIDDVMRELNFSRTKSWRHYENPDCPFLVEFPPTPLAVGEEYLDMKKVAVLKNQYGKLRILKVIDCIKDRLAAFYHWGDRPSMEQAVMVAENHSVSLEELKKWSEGEGSLDKFDIFVENLKRTKSNK